VLDKNVNTTNAINDN